MKIKVRELVSRYSTLPLQTKASFWFLVCSFTQKAISVLTTPIFTRIMPKEFFGDYEVYTSWLAILTAIITLYLYAGVYTQGLIKFSEEARTFSSSLQGLSFSLVAIWSVIYYLFRDFWNKLIGLSTLQMTCILVILWTSSAFSLWSAEQRVNLKYRSLLFATLTWASLQPILEITFVVNSSDKVTARILGIAITSLLVGTPFFFVQLRKGKVFFSKKYWKYALKFNIPLIPHYLSQSVLSGADKIMIEKIIGKAEAGIYGLAYSVSQVMTLFNTALMATMSPWMYQKMKDKKEKDISNISYISLAGIALLNLLLIIMAPEAIFIFAPESYYEAIYVIPPVAMSCYFTFLYDLFAKFEFYYEKTKTISLATMICAGANIVLNAIFIPKYGYLAAAYTTLVCYILYSIFHYIMMKIACKKNNGCSDVYDFRIILAITFVFLAVGFTFMSLYKFMIIRYIIFAMFISSTIIFHKKILSYLKTML